MQTSTPAIASMPVAVSMRESAASLSAALMRSFSTDRASCFSIAASPAATASAATSLITTSKPLVAHTWAMPRPIVPGAHDADASHDHMSSVTFDHPSPW